MIHVKGYTVYIQVEGNGKAKDAEGYVEAMNIASAYNKAIKRYKDYLEGDSASIHIEEYNR